MNAAATASEWNRVVLLFSIPHHTRPFSSQLKKLHPSISTRLHRYRLDPLKYGSRYDRYLFARYIYISLLFAIRPSSTHPFDKFNANFLRILPRENRGWINAGEEEDG